jgi:Transposase DDE domain
MSAKDVRYRVRNWSSYNDSLRKRGSLTVWIDEETIKNWYAIPTGKAVQQFHYSDAAIQLALSLRAIYRLPLRATQGFLQSIFKMMSVKLDVPDYTTICRRAAKQKVTLDCELPKEPMHLAIDSTGLKIFGEGEWKVRIHGVGKRRTWRKLHIGLDVETREIVAAAVTEANGKEAWKAEVSYHKRSLAENGIYRLKTIFGDHMASRKMDRQVTEGRMRTKILNQMTHLGMPRSEKVYI